MKARIRVPALLLVLAAPASRASDEEPTREEVRKALQDAYLYRLDLAVLKAPTAR